MTQMTKGSNVAFAASALRATLLWTGGSGVPDVDASALLVQADGKVGSDADFVFYNQPQHSSGSVRHLGKSTTGQFSDITEIDLAHVPLGFDRVVLAASAEGGTFGQVPGLELLLADRVSGAELARFAMTATNESGLVTGELYRHSGGWKFRAVGQGYSTGLAGIATDFGIGVDDAAAAAPLAQPVAPPAAAYVPPPPVAPPAAPQYLPPPEPVPPPPLAPPVALVPPAPVLAPPVAPPASPVADYPPVAPPAVVAQAPPPETAFAPPVAPMPPPPAPAAAPQFPQQPPQYVPRVQQDPPPTAAPQYPPAQPPAAEPVPAAPAATPPSGPPPSAGVSLRRSEPAVNLVNSDGSPLLRFMVAAGWFPAPGLANVDLDASVIAFSGKGEELEIVWHRNASEYDGALRHLGDSKSGVAEGDAEEILVDLDRLPQEVAALVFTINSFTGQKFTDIARAYFRMADQYSGYEMIRFDLTDSQPSTAVLMAMVRRSGPGRWDVRAIGEFHDTRFVKKLVEPAARHVVRP